MLLVCAGWLMIQNNRLLRTIEVEGATSIHLDGSTKDVIKVKPAWFLILSLLNLGLESALLLLLLLELLILLCT